uniref:Histone-lysine N-methyltransferase n=1 Tax=Scylla olivacea TaxID=85551 RepID=A0A0P4WF97_SCYOL
MEEEASKVEMTASPVFQAKLQSLEKLNTSFSEFSEEFNKLKQSFHDYKTKSFFFPHLELTKPFVQHLKQIEGELQVMGNLLKKEVGNKFESKVSSPNVSLNAADLPELTGHTPDHSEIPGRASGFAGITPPASEVGNDEILAIAIETTDNNNKRKNRTSAELPSPKSKRLRRTLIDDYMTRKDGHKNSEGDEQQEEEEFEVLSIVDMKKSQGNYTYHVTWKGYGPEDNTWEPSSNLTSCEELLVEFFKSKFRQRDKEDQKLEDLCFFMHYDPSIKGAIRRAVFEHYCDDSRIDYRSIMAQIFSARSMVSRPQIDMDELIERAIIARKREKFLKHLKMIQEEKITQDVKGKREVQLAELRKWERKINSICSDPAKLCVENNIDLEMPPMDFVYINECRAGEGVTIPSDPLVGCECDDCSTNKRCCATQMGSWVPYNKAGRVKVSLGTAIYECNKRCLCGPNCSNRVVQKGRTISLCIFRTANGRGWGVKAMENIKKDSLVTEYVGEVITSEEAERRGRIYDAQRCTYLFDLDYNKGDQNPYTVDAAKFGNVSHFINHSCDPNLVVYNVWVDCLDPDLPRLALFATQDIKKGEELTFDYNSGLESESNIKKEPKEEGFTTPEKGKDEQDAPELFMKTPKGNRGLQYGKTRCRCGAANCRQYFF